MLLEEGNGIDQFNSAVPINGPKCKISDVLVYGISI